MGRSQIAGLILGLLTVFVTIAELRRVAAGELLLVHCPWDASASSAERHDARRTADRFLLWAVAAVSLIGFTVAARPELFRKAENQTPDGWNVAVLAFSLAAAADLGTTLWFMHVRGIDFELHPGIRLFAYAYGRSTGPVLAKLLQWAAVLWLCRRWRRWGSIIILAAAILCALAAVHNLGMVEMAARP